jgi:hypothetical protein
MEDDLAGAPYFYISAYTGDEQFNYSDATTLVYGKWIKEGPWKGGILPLNQLEMDNAIQQLQIFYNQALSYLINW